MGSDAVNVQQTGYTSHPELLLSDHKPISATFDIEVGRRESLWGSWG